MIFFLLVDIVKPGWAPIYQVTYRRCGQGYPGRTGNRAGLKLGTNFMAATWAGSEPRKDVELPPTSLHGDIVESARKATGHSGYYTIFREVWRHAGRRAGLLGRNCRKQGDTLIEK